MTVTPVRHDPTDAAADARVSSRARTRVVALGVFVACSAVLAIAAWLTPSPRGYGTHQQLGGGPCGMLVVTGYPCPTCGMTTAFAYTMRGEIFRAAWAQPAGLVLAFAVAGAACVGASTLMVGRWPGWLSRGFPPFWVFFGLLALLLGGWAFKLAAGLATGVLPMREVLSATG